MDTIGVRMGGSTYRHRVEQMRAANPRHKEPRLLTPGEAAGYLGMTEEALKMMTKRGMVPGVLKLAQRKTRYDRRKLDAWIEKAVTDHAARTPQERQKT